MYIFLNTLQLHTKFFVHSMLEFIIVAFYVNMILQFLTAVGISISKITNTQTSTTRQ